MQFALPPVGLALLFEEPERLHVDKVVERRFGLRLCAALANSSSTRSSSGAPS
jgi:hypothetical protein